MVFGYIFEYIHNFYGQKLGSPYFLINLSLFLFLLSLCNFLYLDFFLFYIISYSFSFFNFPFLPISSLFCLLYWLERILVKQCSCILNIPTQLMQAFEKGLIHKLMYDGYHDSKK